MRFHSHLSLGLVGLLSGASAHPVTAVVDVTVVPMTCDCTMAHQTVIIADGHIQQIGDAAKVHVPAGASVVQGRGKYLMPGLADMHIHVRDTTDFALYVAKGVTTVRILRGTPRHVMWRERIAAGEMFGPTIYTSGPFTNLPEISTAADAYRAAVEQKAAGYDFIKIHGSINRVAYDTLVATGRRLGIPVVGHAPRNLPFDVALEARQADISHLEEFVYTYFARKTDDAAVARIPALAGALHRAGIAVTTTLVAYDRIGRQVDSLEPLLAAPEMQYVAPGMRASWERANNDYLMRFAKEHLPMLRDRLAMQQKLLRPFVDSGVRVMLGTDAVGETWVPGWTAHEELRNFVAAGLTPYQALRAATSEPAAFVGAASVFGTIVTGRRADLLLLDGNPLADVRNAERIAGVFLRGRWMPRRDLDERLAAVARAHRVSEASVASLLRENVETAAAARCERNFSSDELELLDLRVAMTTTRLAVDSGGRALERISSGVRRRCDQAVLFNESRLNLVADSLRKARQPQRAIDILEVAEKEFPKSFLVPYYLGEALLAKRDTAAAIAAYKRSVANDSEMMDAIERIKALTKP